MECSFEVIVKADTPEREKVAALLGVATGKGTGEVQTEAFLTLCRGWGEAGVKAGKKLFRALGDDTLMLFGGDSTDDTVVFQTTYGSNGQDIAEAIAHFLAELSPSLSGEVVGDYDEDPYGFRYVFKNGELAYEEGMFADDYGEEFDEEDE